MSDPAAPGAMLPPPIAGFRPASSLPRSNAVPGPGPSSLRNASTEEPPTIRTAPSIAETVAATGTASSNPNGNKDKDVTPAPPTAPATTPAGPSKPVNRPAASKNAIVYNAVQRRNPVTHAIKNVATEVGDIAADFQVGTHNGVLFLSLKYHRLHPEYIHQRIEKMKNMYNLRILMVLCDVSEHQQSLRELTKIAIINDYTTFVAWSNDEVAQYLITFKSYEHKSADTLKEKVHQSYHDQLQHVLTSGKKVNKTDSDNLASQFGSFSNISKQPAKVLSNVKGLGSAKVTSLMEAFGKPFIVGGLKRDLGSQREKGKNGSQDTEGEIGTKFPSDIDFVTSSSKGKQREENTENGGEEERAGSPEWPEEEASEGEGDDRVPSPPIARGRAPSRSPGLSPEPRTNGSEEAWKDPLEDEDVDENESEDESPAAKRLRAS